MKIELDDLVIDSRLQMLAEIDTETVENYTEVIEGSDEDWPFNDAIQVCVVDGKNYVTDGFHRFQACQKARMQEAECNVTKATWDEAVVAALGANKAHGLRRTNADKRRAVVVALHSFGDWADNRIATVCGVSHPFVGKLRNQLVTVTSCGEDTRTGTDGKKRKVKKKPTKKTTPKPVVEVFETELADEPSCDGEPRPLENGRACKEALNAINEAIRKVKAVEEMEGTELFANRRTSIVRILENAKGEVQVTIPVAICPRCNGEKCPQCGNHGWVNAVLKRELESVA